MIPESRLNQALAALNAVLVTARVLAYERRPYEQLVAALDAAEYLPRLLADDSDQTAAFHETLVGLTSLDPGFRFALECFEGKVPGRW